MTISWFDPKCPNEGLFSDKKLKAKNDQKAHLKAELAFAYEIKNCSAQKVDYWVVFVSQNSEKYGREMKKTKIASKIMASSRISPTRWGHFFIGQISFFNFVALWLDIFENKHHPVVNFLCWIFFDFISKGQFGL